MKKSSVKGINLQYLYNLLKTIITSRGIGAL